MKKILILSWLVLSFYTLTSQNDINRISQAEKIYGLSKLWQEVNYNFAYMERVDLDWDAEYLRYIDKVIETKNDKEYYDLLERFLNLLKEGHTMLYMRPKHLTNNDIYPAKYSWFYVDWIEDDYYVFATRNIYKDSLPFGSRIIEINGLTTEIFFKENLKAQTSSVFSHSIKWRNTYNFNFSNIQQDMIEIKFITPENTTHKLNFENNLNPYDYGWSVSKSIFSKNSLINEPFFKSVADNIIYLNLAGHMSQNLIDYFDSIVPELQKSQGIIIDLRSSHGGSNIGPHIASYFTDEKEILTFIESRVNIATKRAHGAYTDTTFSSIIGEPRFQHLAGYYNNSEFIRDSFKTTNNVPHEKKLNKPIVLLIDTNIASATEGFLQTFKALNIGTTVGQPTMGSCSQPLLVSLPQGGVGWIASQRTMTGEEVFYYIEPDVHVNKTIEQDIEGIDVIFEKGLEVLKEKINKSKNME